MRTVTSKTTSQWVSGDYTGDNRPMARVTLQKMHIHLFKKKSKYGVQNPGDTLQTYASALFGQVAKPVELTNIKSVERTHSVDQDAATCVITLYNTDELPPGQGPDPYNDFDDLGKYTFNRGTVGPYPGSTNSWKNLLVPDRLLRTYEGFGFDATVCPEKDVNLYPTGVWLIDDVQYTTDGLIVIRARDMARLLIDQIAFPSVVPFNQYPLSFLVRQPHIVQAVIPISSWKRPTYDTSSGIVGYNSHGAQGHKDSFAFDGDNTTYWLSHGHAAPHIHSAYEWVQGTFSSHDLQAVRVRVWGGPYRVYLSVYADGKWTGSHNIPYARLTTTTDNWMPSEVVGELNPSDYNNNGSHIKFKQAKTVDKEDWVEFFFTKPIANATKIRITLHNLTNSHLGDRAHHYRGGIRSIQWTNSAKLGPVQDGKIGNYNFYEDIVKLLLAYGGFWWPGPDDDAIKYQMTYADGSTTSLPAPRNDGFLGSGRVWADIMTTGAWGPAQLDPTVWDKKPLMDCINYVKDVLGYQFFVDESGGAVFRLPNVYSVGNYRQGGASDAGYHRGSSGLVTIRDDQTLVNNGTVVSSRNVRERYFVANLSGKVAAMSIGYNPFPSGLRRIAGWTDQHFQHNSDCQAMADLLGLRALFTYRTNTLSIVAHPGMQIDDQVRVQDHITSDYYIHRIMSLHSVNDLSTGTWSYDLETHWLGATPFTDWVFDPGTLDAETRKYLNATGLSNVTGTSQF